jgi:protein SCO1/2
MRNYLLLFPLIFLLFSCSESTSLKFNGSDITEAKLNPSFELTSHLGKITNIADFSGKVAAIFFGFTHCPDVCPTTMYELKAIKDALGSDGDKLQVIFVSLDPERDNIGLLEKFIPSFDSSFIGLTGTAADIKKMAGQYKIYYQKVGDDKNYTIDHSSAIYLIDKKGDIRIRHPYGSSQEMIVNDIRTLLSI